MVAYKETYDQEGFQWPTLVNSQMQAVNLEAISLAVVLHRHSGGGPLRRKHCTIVADPYRCCKSNPCTDTPTCKDGDLVPAFLGRPEQFTAYALSASPSSASTPGNTPSNAPSSGSSNGAVIGGAVGGSLGAAILIGCIVFFLCRRRKRKQQVAHHEAGAASTPKMRQRFEESVSAQYVGQSRRCIQKPF